MFDTLGLFRDAMGMARHAGAAQAASAQNMAHADTPGYRALRVPSFADAMTEDGRSDLRATRPGHLFGTAQGRPPQFTEVAVTAEPGGNAVTLEEEMVHANSAKRDHGRALAIYRHGLTVLRTALGNG